MKHILGNTPKCGSCRYYTEERQETRPLERWMTGWCVNRWVLSHGINGHKLDRPLSCRQARDLDQACNNYIEADTGYTLYEILTGISEKTGEKINFGKEDQETEGELWLNMGNIAR